LIDPDLVGLDPMGYGEVLLILAVTVVGIRLLRRYAPRLRLLDRPNHRSLHREPVPRGGGMVFVLAALTDLFFFHRQFFFDHLLVMAALMTMLGIGILDDRHAAAPKTKFLVIALATLLLWEEGLLIDGIGTYFGIELRFGWLALPFTYFAVSGFTNAFNLIDGIDGLAGSFALVFLGAFLYLGWREGDAFLVLLSLAFMTGVVGFLLFNWHPASIFMGDSGSLTLGFLISTLSVRALEYLPSVSVLYLGAIPILDTLVAMVRRKRAGYSAIMPDRCHFHHLLLERLGSVPRTVLLLVAVQVLFLAVGLVLPRESDQGMALILFLTLFIGVYRLTLREIEQRGIDCYRRRSGSPRERDIPGR
jgi:UDP-GlcNAc:undecaprenyl-phosphate GlcNAc-1-phosphate transferase